jgi:hypothetical protein
VQPDADDCDVRFASCENTNDKTAASAACLAGVQPFGRWRINALSDEFFASHTSLRMVSSNDVLTLSGREDTLK